MLASISLSTLASPVRPTLAPLHAYVSLASALLFTVELCDFFSSFVLYAAIVARVTNASLQFAKLSRRCDCKLSKRTLRIRGPLSIFNQVDGYMQTHTVLMMYLYHYKNSRQVHLGLLVRAPLILISDRRIRFKNPRVSIVSSTKVDVNRMAERQ